MPLGPVNISEIKKMANVNLDTRILLRRAQVQLQYEQHAEAAETIATLMQIFETEMPSDAELHELDACLIVARRAIGKLFGPPDSPAPAAIRQTRKAA